VQFDSLPKWGKFSQPWLCHQNENLVISVHNDLFGLANFNTKQDGCLFQEDTQKVWAQKKKYFGKNITSLVAHKHGGSISTEMAIP
jgi:hypothetical protein